MAALPRQDDSGARAPAVPAPAERVLRRMEQPGPGAGRRQRPAPWSSPTVLSQRLPPPVLLPPLRPLGPTGRRRGRVDLALVRRCVGGLALLLLAVAVAVFVTAVLTRPPG